jgi:hypothetical protein
MCGSAQFQHHHHHHHHHHHVQKSLNIEIHAVDGAIVARSWLLKSLTLLQVFNDLLDVDVRRRGSTTGTQHGVQAVQRRRKVG